MSTLKSKRQQQKCSRFQDDNNNCGLRGDDVRNYQCYDYVQNGHDQEDGHDDHTHDDIQNDVRNDHGQDDVQHDVQSDRGQDEGIGIILEKVRKENINLVRFELTDVHGVARSKTIPVCHFEEKAMKGLAFILYEILGMGVVGDNVEGAGYGEEVGYPDGLALPDLSTFQALPWLDGTARILIEPTLRGIPVPAHPRVLARKQLDRLGSLGISLLAAHEHEFRVLNKETLRMFAEDESAHSTIRNTPINGLLNQILRYLPQVGVPVEAMHSEVGPGMIEITYKPALGIRSADNAHTYKTSIKEIALLNGFVASFMSNPLQDKFINSCHFCHSLWDAQTGAPLLFDNNDEYNLSEVGQHWIAGLLAHAPATKVLMSPTVNCFQSACAFAGVPVNATWGVDNRTCLVRVKARDAKDTYMEHRLGTSACNPYICLAAVVAAGCDGIINKLELPPPVSGSAFREDQVAPETVKLPTTLEDAVQALLDDQVICDALGEDFINCFTTVKRHEAKMAREAEASNDADWQFREYFYYI